MRDVRIARRDFLALGLTGAVTAFLYGVLRRDASAAPLLRPPGAQDEGDFVSRCLRCQECVRACLTECLEPAGKEYGAARLWTPRFNPARAKCEFELCGRACALACPVGAIRRPADDEVRIGTASVNRAKCIAWNEGKDCLVCYERCSYQAIEVDSRGRPRVIADRCTGCGACQNTCVTCPDPAIVVYPPGEVPAEGGGGRRGRQG
ncbi:MAG: 4Fe-4S dicluster domain-containing protein [Actinobacteria bacterium]|nr:4Fe-4S dicluster domain-containing protein [Actinomycetota bacterium]